MGERKSGTRREEISDWLEEMAVQLRTGTLMVDGESLPVPEELQARIKVKSKDGGRRLKLDLEWPEERDLEKRAAGKKSKKSRKERMPGINGTVSPDDVETANGNPGPRAGDNGQARNGGSADDGKCAGERPSVRDHDSHVLVCKGGDCSKKGGKETKKALKSGLRAEGMNGDVRVDSVDCLGLCKQGPNVIVYPEGSWYLGLKERDVPLVIDEHLKKGAPVERLTAVRKPRKKKSKS